MDHFDPILDTSGSFRGSFWDHSGPFEVDVWLLFFRIMLKFVVLKNPSACFRHGGGIGAHAPLDPRGALGAREARVRSAEST